MIPVQWRELRAKADGSGVEYGTPVGTIAIRMHEASQEQRLTTEIAEGKRISVYVLGRRSMLAKGIKVGDTLDDREVKRVVPNREGYVEVFVE